MPKILFLDIETAPSTGYFWGLFDQTIGLNQVETPGYVLCWAAKWYGQPHVMWSGVNKVDVDLMMTDIRDLLDEADIVVHYNGQAFDIPTLNAGFVKSGLYPPAPFKQVDLYLTVRKQFKILSNKLEYAAEYFRVGQKMKHEGFDLWRKCMQKDPEAWQRMKEYKKQDVLLLEDLYKLLRPWIVRHPNLGMYVEEDSLICPSCGSTNLHRRGTYPADVYVYQRYRCMEEGCGKWSRGRKALHHSVQVSGV